MKQQTKIFKQQNFEGSLTCGEWNFESAELCCEILRTVKDASFKTLFKGDQGL